MDKLLALVKSIAPGVASLLDGPLAGVAQQWIAGKLGVSADAESILEAIRSKSSAIIQIKELEAQYGSLLSSLQFADVKDAREKAPQYAGFMKGLALTVTVGFFASLALLFAPIHIDATEKQLFMMLIGMLVSKWQTIIDFYFGASNHS